MADIFEITGRIHSTSQEHVVAPASEIFDDTQNKKQNTINADVARHENEIHGTGGIDSRLSDVEQMEQIVIDGGDAQIATGADFTNPDATKRAKIPTVGAIVDGLNDGIYDVSKRNPTAGPNSDGKFTLEYVLNNADSLIPTGWRHGGMTISFVQTSDNKYIQARCMAQNFTADITQWQGVDDEPTFESSDLVKSGGVYKEFYGIPNDSQDVTINTTSGTIIPRTTKYDVDLKAGKRYIVTKISSVVGSGQIFFYKENGDIITSVNFGEGNLQLVVILESDCPKVGVYATAQQVTGTGTLSLNFYWESNDKGSIGNTKDELQRDIADKVRISCKNLFDASKVTSGYYFNSNGLLEEHASWSISDYIPVTQGVTYCITKNGGAAVGSNSKYFCFYDVNKVFLSVVASDNTTVTAPQNTVYLRISNFNSNTDVQVEIGSSRTEYEEYNPVIKYVSPLIPTIVNDLTTGGADKALAAEQGKNLKTQIDVLSDAMNGAPAINEHLNINCVQGETIVRTDHVLNVDIKAGRTFVYGLNSGDFSKVSQLVAFFYKADGTVATVTYNQGQATGSSVGVNSGANNREIVAVDDIAKVMFYSDANSVIGTGTISASITADATESIDARINEAKQMPTIVNNLTEGGTDKSLSAEQGKVLGETLYGQPPYSAEFSVNAVAGSSINITLDVDIKGNKTYNYEFTGLGTIAAQIALFFLDENGTTLSGPWGFTDSLNPRALNLEINNDVKKLKVFASGTGVTSSGTINFSILGEASTGIKGFIENTNDSIEALEEAISEEGEKSVGEIDNTAALLVKEMIKADNRGYFFDNDEYDTVDSYVDTSYLEQKIKEVPKGKSFILFTDSHIDYSNNIWKRQKETIIQKYVRDRLGIKNVVFAGDLLGAVNDNANHTAKYEAAKIMSIYNNEKFNAFGGDYIFCMGNHDLNYPAYDPNKHDPQPERSDVVIEDDKCFDISVGLMARYGNVHFYDKGLESIQQCSLTSEEKKQLSAWMKMNYYYDDNKNKIRYLVIESGDFGAYMTVLGSTGTWNSNYVITDFVCESLRDIPNDYDVVIVMHMMYYNANYDVMGGAWYRLLHNILTSYKKKESISFTNYVGGASTDKEKELVYIEGDSSYLRSYDFSHHNGSGRILIVHGHYHADSAFIVNYDSGNYSMQYLDGDISQNNPTIDDTSILVVLFDRCCGIGQGNDMVSHNVGISYPDEGTGAGQEQRIGTVNEVLFDVVTITPDNKVVCTRFGAGNNRTYDIP